MKTIKLIDLLNKIANGEEVPKKIAIQNEVLIYNEDEILNLQDCYYMADEEDATWRIWAYELNYEVEILEEEKKIPEKLDIRQEKNIKNNWKWKVYGKEHSYNISTPQKIIADKLNEIIDYLDYLKSKGE